MARTEQITFEADGNGVPASLSLPSDVSTPVPGVVVIHDALGLSDDIKRIAARFADEGYAAIAPDLYAGRGPKPICVMRVMREMGRDDSPPHRVLEAARVALAARPEVDASRMGCVGFCMGGGFAVLFGVRAPLGAAACFYGAVPKDVSELEGICPVVGSYGERDKVFLPHAQRLEAHLEALGVPHDVKIYPGVGHSFMNQMSPLMTWLGRIGPLKGGYDETVSEHAWGRMLAFFGEHLG
jgi:carboxymethylenebutenolidase